MKTINPLKELEYCLNNLCYLDMDPQLAMQIAKRLCKNKQNIKNDFLKIKLVILSNINIDFIKDCISYSLFQRAINADIFSVNYGTMITQLLDPNSETYKHSPDYILIWPTYRDIQKYGYSIKEEVSFWNSLWEIAKKKNIKIFQILFDKPPFINLNNSYNLQNSNLISHIAETNINLQKKYSNEITFISMETLQISVGTEDWHSNRMYSLCKQPFAFEALPKISHFIAANISGKLGKSKKVLVLDLDNTIWGGEIGDLGNKGITLGSETSEGEGFIYFQKYIKQLSDLGIILAVCSKNKEKVAKEVFIKHADMVLKLEDIACFVANFKDKASNISYIKEFLNVGYDTIVFVDDSKVECEWVKNKIPLIETINLVGDPSTFPNQIDRLGFFIKGTVTEEDKVRVKTFKTKKK